jgi:hypothetical protein
MSIIRTIHGELRWIIAIVAIIILIKFAIGWLGKRSYQPLDRTLLLVFSSLMDVNLLLGLLLLFTMGISGMARIEHAVTMILAVVAAHLTMLWRGTEDSAVKYRNQLLMVALSLVFVILGVIRLRGALYAQGFF